MGHEQEEEITRGGREVGNGRKGRKEGRRETVRSVIPDKSEA